MNSSQKYVICRLCGMIIKTDEINEPCPACGAPQKSFVPFKMNVDEKRLKFLKLDLHPISTHFSEGFMVMILLIFFISMIQPTLFGIILGHGGVLDLFIYLEPFCVILTGLLGYYDGKMRYKKVNSKFLNQKKILVIIFVILSVLILIFHMLYSNDPQTVFLWLEGIAIILGIGVASKLGMIGSKLTCNIVPKGNPEQ